MTVKQARLTFIIPAYNAAETVSDTLRSLQGQTRPNWKAIVVDDGSTDTTCEVANDIACDDERVSVHSIQNGRVCRARNFGLDLADTEWVCFLDADDWVSNEFVEEMMAAATEEYDFIYCGYRRVTPEGETAYEFIADDIERQGFAVIARECRTCIHSIVIRRSLVSSVGGFDPSLAVCEDWDLWARVLRTTDRIKFVPKTMASYRMGDATLSRNHEQMVKDGLTVLSQNCAPDPRVENPLSAYANGICSELIDMQSTYFVVWNAAADIGVGNDGARLVDHLREVDYGGYDKVLAKTIVEAVAIGARLQAGELFEHWHRFSANVSKMLAKLAASNSKAATELGLTYAVEREVLRHLPVGISGKLDFMMKAAIDFQDIQSVRKPPSVDMLMLEFSTMGKLVHTMEMGLFGDLSIGDIRRLALTELGAVPYLRKTRQWTNPVVVFGAALLFLKRLAGNIIRAVRKRGAISLRSTARLSLHDAAYRFAGHVAEDGHFIHIGTERAKFPAPLIQSLHNNGHNELRLPARSVEHNVQTRADELLKAISTFRVPILAYHRIASEGPEALRTWRVDPESFAQQLRLLKENGFYTVTSQDILKHRALGWALPGRPVHLTFDDAYQDFSDIAWPILKAHGFGAEVFVVTDKVGMTSDWDVSLNGDASLMDWDTIRALQEEGVVFGSHLATHTPATNLSSANFLTESISSRAALESHLNVPVTSIAAPYGVIDERYNRILHIAGYGFGVSCDSGVADIRAHPFTMPRLEVSGRWNLTEFAKSLDLSVANESDEAEAVAHSNSNSAELVSVIIPAYNAEGTIDETLSSVCSQTYSNLEILVIDDGSRDRTREIVLRHAAVDTRIRLIVQENGGVAAARNHGIAEAKGELIAPVDSDDLWMSDKIKRQVSAMNCGGQRVGLVYTWFSVIDPNGRVIDRRHTPQEEGDMIYRLCSGNVVGNASSTLIRKSAIVGAGGYDTSLRSRGAQGCEDLLLYFRIAQHYEFCVVRDHLTGYRRMPQAMSSDVFQMLRSYQLVTEEMRAKYPSFASETIKGEAMIAAWLFWKALGAGKLLSAASLVVHIVKMDLRFALSKILPDLVANAVSKIMSILRSLKNVSPDDRFATGSDNTVEALK